MKDVMTTSSVDRRKIGKQAGIVGIIINLALSASKIACGMIFSSIAITADGFNNLSDAASSIFTLIGFKLSEKPADKEHPFGHARSEYISGLIIAFAVLLVGAEIGRSSIIKIFSPESVNYGTAALIVLAAAVLVKLWLYFFYTKSAKKISSGTLFAAAQDSRNDVITTSGVLVCAIIAKYTGLYSLDGYVGLGVAAFIIYSGTKLLIETLSPLLGRAPDGQLVESIVERIMNYSGVLGVHDLVVHDYGPGSCFATIHCEMDYKNDIMESHEVTDLIERDFARDGIHLVVHLDPIVTDDEEVNELKSLAVEVLAGIDRQLSLHDFRVVKSTRVINLLFDVVLPDEMKMTAVELEDELLRRLKQHDDRISIVLSFDRSYTG